MTFKNFVKILDEYKDSYKSRGSSNVLKDAISSKSNQSRTILYAFMCGSNENDVSEQEFLAACNRFGIDNPMPVITQRLHFYGNSQQTTGDLLEQLYKKYNEPAFLDPKQYICVTEKHNEGVPIVKNIKEEYNKLVDMYETKIQKREAKKKSGAYDLKILDRLETAHKFTTPAEAIIVRGCKIKIKDI